MTPSAMSESRIQSPNTTQIPHPLLPKPTHGESIISECPSQTQSSIRGASGAVNTADIPQTSSSSSQRPDNPSRRVLLKLQLLSRQSSLDAEDLEGDY
ncbi:hypothetical protein BOTBODRAFT_427802 [Botryobasidium botryosum FD-172 SS1]|uniref:Uncharacterized protein n=1 Tax=Botryobasidium botryosum (strain FD-172 SS1) TaxID=930990 RepID=A0A067M879_BOTB1|nr:hypothetical protein BOTBODRAFT_427802 [Botryobasidium botryosum FD-172 SS1]